MSPKAALMRGAVREGSGCATIAGESDLQPTSFFCNLLLTMTIEKVLSASIKKPGAVGKAERKRERTYKDQLAARDWPTPFLSSCTAKLIHQGEVTREWSPKQSSDLPRSTSLSLLHLLGRLTIQFIVSDRKILRYSGSHTLIGLSFNAICQRRETRNAPLSSSLPLSCSQP
jgi:hypothetical protein